MHIFRTSKFDSSPSLKNKVDQFMDGMNRNIAKKMQERDVTHEEYKSHMVFPALELLLQLMIESGSAEHVYAR